MTRARVRAVLLAAVLGVAALTGCISIPTTGPIKTVPGEAGVCQGCVNVEVAPPMPGADPQEIVDGYLAANSNYQPDYAIARQFLTAQAADSWQPEAGAKIYSERTATGFGDRVRFTFRLTGRLARDRTYSASQETPDLDLGLVKENGEWRIGQPPDGLLVEQYAFERSYRDYSRYFFGNGLTLVPERIHLPELRNQPTVAAALMTGLLDGPSAWLGPAASTAIPKGTSLVGGSVTLSNEIAEVSLTENLLTLEAPARSQVGAQIVYTLKQVSGVRGVRITVNQQKFLIPEADPETGVLAIDAFSPSIEPEPLVSDQSYALRDKRVHSVRTPDQTPTLDPIMGRLGAKGAGVDSLAVAFNDTQVAAVTDGRTTLRRAAVGSGEVTTLTRSVRDMLRPQFTRYGELWTIARRAGLQQLLLFDGDRPVPVEATVLNGRTITAFRVSPDGSRMALVWRTDAGRDQLGLARIVRGNRVVVDEWRPVDLQQEETQVAQIADVAWLNANELLLLGTTDEDAPRVTIRVAADASEIVPASGASGWNVDRLTVLPRQQSVVVVGVKGQSWRNDGTQWTPYLKGVQDVVHAG